MRKVTAISRALEILQTKTQPVDIPTVMIGMPANTCRATVARGLRRERAKGTVTSKRNGGRFVFWSLSNSQTAKVPLSKPQSKGAARSNIMCRPDNMPTLCDALDMAVAVMVGKKVEFSAFDVTKNLRSQVADGVAAIDTTETGTVYVGGKEIAKIDHEIIKDAVHDLFHRGEMSGYTRSMATDGSHWVYAVAVDPPEVDDDDDSDDDADPSDNGSSGTSYDGSSTL